MNWKDALEYAENLNLGGNNDWRLPNAKELQSIVDYSRSPETSNSAAIDPIFNTSLIKNEAGDRDYPYYWSSTTHLDGPVPEKGAAYIAFGRALGKMHGTTMDVHGAGSQRSDPKIGNATSRGPQGDIIRIKNYVRAVRGGIINLVKDESIENQSKYLEKKTSIQVKKNISTLSRNNKFINRLDKNNDGKIELMEFKRGKKRFNHLDRNNDGYITIDEAPTGPPKSGR